MDNKNIKSIGETNQEIVDMILRYCDQCDACDKIEFGKK